MKELTMRMVNFEMYGKLCSARLCFISQLRSLYVYGITNCVTCASLCDDINRRRKFIDTFFRDFLAFEKEKGRQ